jgi:DnaJ-domain-containing protein 1
MQIFDRISRIIKSNKSDYTRNLNDIFEDEDDELKRIIDELNNEKKTSGKTNDHNKYNDYSNVKEQKTDFPEEIKNAFMVLGISYVSDNEQIKSVYKKKMKEFHPDKVSHLSDEIRNRAESRAKDINEAYNKIRKFKGF